MVDRESDVVVLPAQLHSGSWSVGGFDFGVQGTSARGRAGPVRATRWEQGANLAEEPRLRRLVAMKMAGCNALQRSLDRRADARNAGLCLVWGGPHRWEVPLFVEPEGYVASAIAPLKLRSKAIETY